MEPLVDLDAYLAAAFWVLWQNTPEIAAEHPDTKLGFPASISFDHRTRAEMAFMFNYSADEEAGYTLIRSITNRSALASAWRTARRSLGSPLSPEQILAIAQTCKEMEKDHESNE